MVERLHLPSPQRCEDNANQLLDCVYERQKFKKQDPDILASACLYIIIRFVLWIITKEYFSFFAYIFL